MRGAGLIAAIVFPVLVIAAGQTIAMAEPAPGQDQPAARPRPGAVRAMPPRQAQPAVVKPRATHIVVVSKRAAPPKETGSTSSHRRPAAAPVQTARRTASRREAETTPAPAARSDIAATPATGESQRFLEPSPAAPRRGVRRDEVIVPLPEADTRAQAPAGPPAPPLVEPQGPPLPARLQSAPQPAAEPVPPIQPRSPGPPPPLSTTLDLTRINMIRTAPDQIGQVPSQFMWLRDGLMAARGPLLNDLLFFNDEGRILGRAEFPVGFDTQDIIGLPTAVRLTDAVHGAQITLPRNINPATTTLLQITPNASNPAVRAGRLTRRGPQELVLNDERQNKTLPLTVRSVAGGQLAQAYEVSPGSNDSHYVVTEEIVAVKPALTVRVIVQRFDKDGRLTGVVYVPLDNFEQVSRNFIAITGGGLARVLRPAADGVRIDEYDFAAPPRAGNRRLDDAELRSLSRKLREMPIDTTVQGDNSTPFNDGSEHVELDIAAPPIARDKVLENARAYLTVYWVMQRENFERPGIENRCDPVHSYVWLRPRHFTRDMIGTTVATMPYKWGGDDTPATFRTRTEWGALAGDMCTCRQAEYNYCVFADSAGIDCSGFVSRAWGIEKRGTSGLLDVSTDLDSLAELKPGDAFNWPQRHVRLFVGLTPGAGVAFDVIESSTRFQCGGVCERSYRPSEMNGYRLIRYKGMRDTAVIAGNGQNGTAKPPAAANGGAKPQNEEVKPNGTAAANGTAAPAPASEEATASPAPKGARKATKSKASTAAPPRRVVRGVTISERRTSW